MKKSLRILSMVLAVVMIFGSMSVLGSAYDKYKGNDLTTNDVSFDDVDIPNFSVDQYASMALDEVDRMLAEAQINLDIYIGKLNLSSIDGTVKSINDLLASAAVQNLLGAGLLGDAAGIVDAVDHSIKNTKRANGDINVLWDVLDLVGQLKGTEYNYTGGREETGILYKYVMGTVSLGALDGFIADYKFNVRELVVGLLYGLTGFGGDDWSYFDHKGEVPAEYTGTNGPLKLLQEVLNHYVLGEWKKLDELFYSPTNTTSNVVYSEYEFHVGNANGALVTDAEPNTAAYDYYGYVHPDRWVTQTLGDAIRVSEGAAAPQASYTRVDVYNMCVANNGAGIATYDFVEPLLLYAYNNVAVPVLNRITKRWLREKLGYTFDPDKTEEWAKDENGQPVYDEETGERVRNPHYDYMYMGDEPEELNTDSRIFELFDVDTFEVPRVSLAGYQEQLFIPNLNRNATQILPHVLKADIKLNGGAYVLDQQLSDGDILTFTWTSSEDPNLHYSFDWEYGPNSLITGNAISVVRFLLQVTETEFFSDLLIEKNVYKTPAQVAGMSDQQLMAYIVRSVINANVDTMWIDESYETLADVGLEACKQLAYQDIPQFTYSVPANATNQQKVEKALAILMDVAAYKLNAELDTNIDATGTGLINNGSTNNTGLVGYLGNGGNYGTTAATIAKWAVKTYTDTQYGNILAGINPQLLTSATENSLWNDLDTVINSIIPIKANSRPWISGEIAGQTQVVKSLIFDYLVYPIVDLNFENIFKIFDKNSSGAFQTDSIERVLVDTVRRVFELLFPGVFKSGIVNIDSFLNNQNLAQMVSDLACTLSATCSYSGLANSGTISGRGKTIIEFGLPIVCMILGLSDTQEFKELENYAPNVFSAADGNTTAKFLIYNGSTGVNTAYKTASGQRVIDKLYTYKIKNAGASVVAGNGTVTLSGVPTDYQLAAGASKEVTVTGLTPGQMLAITFEYEILDETGTALKKPGTDTTATLTSKKYVYVGTTDQGDDEALLEYNFNGGTIQAPSDIYVSGGLSTINNFAFRYEDNKNNTSKDVTVSSVSVTAANGHNDWVARTDRQDIYTQTVAGKGGTYVFTPFKVADPAYHEAYKYQKDAEGKVIYDETTGLPEIIGVDTEALDAAKNEYYVPNGSYTITTVFSAPGATDVQITTRVHLYNDWGLSGLLNSAIAANRSSASLDSTGNGYLTDYNQAIEATAAFLLPPRSNGAGFDTWVNLTTGNNRNGNYNNKYAEFYAELYYQVERIRPHSAGSNAEDMWSTINGLYPYNYTRETASFDGTDAYYKEYLEYDATNYGYAKGKPYGMGQRNFLGHTYQAFKDAANYANDLIDRQLKYINGDPDTWADVPVAERAERVEAYNKAVEDARSNAISSVEAAYAIHRANLMYERLRELPIPAGANSKLEWAISEFGGITNFASYSVSSTAAYQKAVTFANGTYGESTSTPERINRAMNELIIAWKGLVEGADYSDLISAVSAAKAFITADARLNNKGIVNGNIAAEDRIDTLAGQQDVYTQASYAAFLRAIKAGERLIADQQAGNDLGVNDQYILDNAVTAIEAAQAALELKQGGGDDEPEEPSAVLLDEEGIYDIFGQAFTTGIGDCEYFPVIDSDILSNIADYSAIEEGDYADTPVDGVIYGLPEGFDDQTLTGIFNVENATITATEATEGFYGSGSLVIIKTIPTQDNPERIYKCYMAIYRGDIDGNGEINADDLAALIFFSSDIDGYYFDEENRYFRAAMDLSGDGNIDADDIMYMIYYMSLDIDFNQATGEPFQY